MFTALIQRLSPSTSQCISPPGAIIPGPWSTATDRLPFFHPRSTIGSSRLVLLLRLLLIPEPPTQLLSLILPLISFSLSFQIVGAQFSFDQRTFRQKSGRSTLSPRLYAGLQIIHLNPSNHQPFCLIRSLSASAGLGHSEIISAILLLVDCTFLVFRYIINSRSHVLEAYQEYVYIPISVVAC